jgi:hypothetical protein
MAPKTKKMSQSKMTFKMGKNSKKEKGDKGKTDTIIDTTTTTTTTTVSKGKYSGRRLMGSRIVGSIG